MSGHLDRHDDGIYQGKILQRHIDETCTMDTFTRHIACNEGDTLRRHLPRHINRCMEPLRQLIPWSVNGTH